MSKINLLALVGVGAKGDVAGKLKSMENQEISIKKIKKHITEVKSVG